LIGSEGHEEILIWVEVWVVDNFLKYINSKMNSKIFQRKIEA